MVQLPLYTEAWTEQAECVTQATSESGDVDNDQGSPVISPGQPDKPSFFLTDRQISKSLDFESAELIDRGGCGPVGVV